MDSSSNNPQRKREMKEAELESRKDQRNALKFEFEQLLQTRQDTAAVAEKLATVVAEIARLEQELAAR
jgi:hypothetical protein